MYHVAIISENRILLKQVYEMMEDTALLRIHIVPFSMDAYEVFYQNHTDIVILDTSVFLPYDNILEQLKQCQWNYHVLLLHEGTPEFAPSHNTFWLAKDKLSPELFYEIFLASQKATISVRKENTLITLDWYDEHTFSIHPDAYHLLYIKLFHSQSQFNPAVYNAFLAIISDYCTPKVIFHTDSELLIYISRSDIKKSFNFPLISQIIFQNLGLKTCLLYEKNINWSKFYDTCMKLKAHQCFSYFLSGELCSLSDLQQNRIPAVYKDLKKQYMLLLEAILKNDLPGSKHLLQDLYLHVIKPSYDFPTREYIRLQLYFLHYLLTKKPLIFHFFSVEDELAYLLNSRLLNPYPYPSARIQELLGTAVLTIYSRYETTISLEGIAEELSLNKIYLNRLFKECFGLTVLEALQILRLLHAKFFLLNSDKKVADIGKDNGFLDAGYFGRFFRKSTGYTPLEFRMKREDEKEMENLYAGIMAI